MKRYISVLFLCLVLSMSGRTVVDTDIPYVKHGDDYRARRCLLDISHPEDTTLRLPVIIWFHGGGLTGGSKYFPSGLAGEGYVVVAPNYRLLPEVGIDACIDDAAAAVAWVRENIGKYGGDSGRLFVSGHSAGGYLASMIGLDRKWLRAYGMEADSLAGILPCSGQAITHYEWRRMNGISEKQPVIDEYAPLYYVRPDAPPFIIISGDRELELLGRYEENSYMWRMMKIVGHPYVRIHEMGGYDHGGMVDPAVPLVRDYVDRISKEK